MTGNEKLKDTELLLIHELMKNSRRSDRDIARTIGVSQPTGSRMIRKLENEGYIREYTAIPEPSKLGFEILSVSFVKYKAGTPTAEIKRLREAARTFEQERGVPVLSVMVGMGMGFDRVIIMYHRDYASYFRFEQIMKGAAGGNVERMESFLTVLDDENHMKTLSMSSIANFLLKANSIKPRMNHSK